MRFWLILCCLLFCSPSLALEIQTRRPPDNLRGQISGKGLSLEGNHLFWWDLSQRSLLNILPESPCSGPVSWYESEGSSGGEFSKIYSVQKEGVLYTWCPEDTVFSRWQIATGKLLNRISLADMKKGTEPNYFYSRNSSPNWFSDGKVAVLHYRNSLLKLFDKQGKLLKEKALSKSLNGLWFNQAKLAGQFRADEVTLWNLPDLSEAGKFVLPVQEQILGLTDTWLVSGIHQPWCKQSTQTEPLEFRLGCTKHWDQGKLVLRFRELPTGHLSKQKLFEDVIDAGLSGNQIWILQANQLQILKDPDQPVSLSAVYRLQECRML